MAQQQEVNDHADWVAAQQQAAKAQKPELPQPRKKVPPTREEFEAAVDRMEAWKKRHQEQLARTEDQWKFVIRREYATARDKHPDTFLIKRYKHHHAPVVSAQTKIV